MGNENCTIKTAMEIGSLSADLYPQNQAYVLNTINALLYSQKIIECEKTKNNDKKVG